MTKIRHSPLALLLIGAAAFGAFLAASLDLELDFSETNAAAHSSGPKEWSRTEPFPQHNVYFPGTETLAPDEMRKTYDGPLDLETDFMTWNVTKDGIRTRMAVVNEEGFPAPVQRQKQPPDSMKAYKWTALSLSGVEPESAAVTNALIDAFNKENGTDVKPSLTGIPFMDKPPE